MSNPFPRGTLVHGLYEAVMVSSALRARQIAANDANVDANYANDKILFDEMSSQELTAHMDNYRPHSIRRSLPPMTDSELRKRVVEKVRLYAQDNTKQNAIERVLLAYRDTPSRDLDDLSASEVMYALDALDE